MWLSFGVKGLYWRPISYGVPSTHTVGILAIGSYIKVGINRVGRINLIYLNFVAVDLIFFNADVVDSWCPREYSQIKLREFQFNFGKDRCREVARPG